MPNAILIPPDLTPEQAICLAIFLDADCSWWCLLKNYGDEGFLESICLDMSKKGLLIKAKQRWTLSNKGWEYCDTLLPILQINYRH